MVTQATGTVVDGQLKLDRPLTLANDSRVVVTIEVQISSPETREQALEAWLSFLEEHPVDSRGVRFTREELHERR